MLHSNQMTSQFNGILDHLLMNLIASWWIWSLIFNFWLKNFEFSNWLLAWTMMMTRNIKYRFQLIFDPHFKTWYFQNRPLRVTKIQSLVIIYSITTDSHGYEYTSVHSSGRKNIGQNRNRMEICCHFFSRFIEKSC